MSEIDLGEWTISDTIAKSNFLAHTRRHGDQPPLLSIRLYRFEFEIAVISVELLL